MSLEALSGVWARSSAATPSELLVLLALANWAGSDGRCYPSYAKLAERTRLSERQVMRVVAKFVACGEIERDLFGHREEARGHRRGRTGLQPRNWYRFTAKILGADEDAPEAERGDIHDTLETPEQRGDMGVERGDSHDVEGVTATTGRGDIHDAHIRKYTKGDTKGETRNTARLTFVGRRLRVPRFLHEAFADQLGPSGTAIFDLHAWYQRLDERDDGPIVGDLLAFVRREFADETRRVFGRRVLSEPPRLSYGEVDCPHTPVCAHPTRCRQLTAIAAAKAVPA